MQNLVFLSRRVAYLHKLDKNDGNLVIICQFGKILAIFEGLFNIWPNF